jgi:HEAT repeat protein
MPRPATYLLLCCIALTPHAKAGYLADRLKTDPFTWQVQDAVKRTDSASASVRAGAIEQIGFMRAYDRAGAVTQALSDPDAAVRREAAMALGWLGNADSVEPLLAALSDTDWTVRQAAAAALQNLTGVPFPFHALAAEEKRNEQISAWTSAFKPSAVETAAIKALRNSNVDFFEKADRVRAAGTFKCVRVVTPLIEELRPYLTRNYPADNDAYLYTPQSPAVDARPERAFVQAGLRALGRIGGRKAEAFLIDMLESNVNWACYAAEALGDCGGPKAVEALLAAFPDYARQENHPQTFSSYDETIEQFPQHDAPHLSSMDRIPRVAYEILFALSRLDLSKNQKKVARISPSILATVPNMWDATMVYSEEPWAMVVGYILDQAGVRKQAVDAAFTALGIDGRELRSSFRLKDAFMKQARKNLAKLKSQHAPYAGEMLIACAQAEDIPDLLSLLPHESGWIRIEVAKALALLNAREAVVPLINLLENAKDDADYGYAMDFRRFTKTRVNGFSGRLPGNGYDELNDPSPRFKEAYIRALGILKDPAAVPVLTRYLNNDRNALEIQHAAALALGDIATPPALDALKKAEAEHPVAVVKIVAREALWRNSIEPENILPAEKTELIRQQNVPAGLPKNLVFIKGEREPGNNEQFSKDMTAYSTTDGGPTYRLGRNIFSIETADPESSLRQLTDFTSGYVSDLEVSYDGKKLLFAHSTMDPEPWFHIYEMNADGTGLKQLTFGPYHDVHPNFMPDGRVVFTTSRSGIRDEYHGYPANGLAVMNADGSDIHVIGFNIGRDAEPVVGDDGKILFTRLELFYSRMKTEWNLLSVFPDGIKPVTHYGPERRKLHNKIGGAAALAPPRHRVLRLTQPQSWNGAEYLLNTFKGPMIAGPGRNHETFLNRDNRWAITTPYKIDAETLLVAAGIRPLITKNKPEKGEKVGQADLFGSVDHGLYWMDVNTGRLTLIYNDPEMADFEARPVQPRNVPPVLPASPLTRSRAFSGTVYCSSAFITQDPYVKERGKYIRVVEGIPTITRHQSHNNGGIAWRNHGGAVGRVLGTVPLATDGSFSLELPSDRLFHLQVLDSDRRVMGNELIWQYVRPKEVKGCVGCHENPDDAPSMPAAFPLAQRQAPVQCFPYGDEMQYRAKMWFKGYAPDEREERMRTVNSVNIMGRN